jgi:hypothetical protein
MAPIRFRASGVRSHGDGGPAASLPMLNARGVCRRSCEEGVVVRASPAASINFPGPGEWDRGGRR